MSRLCQWHNPTWIDAYAVGCISEPCRLLQCAEGEMTRDSDDNNRDARSNEDVRIGCRAVADTSLSEETVSPCW
jgi:hypothetical protein